MQHTPLVKLIFLLPLTLIATVVQAQSYVDVLGKLDYPQPARFSGIDGVVKAHFNVGQDGKVQAATYDGHPKLVGQVQHVLDLMQLDPQCRGDFDLTYHFVLRGEKSNEPNTTVTFNAPNEFVVAANRNVVTCSLYSVEKASWVGSVLMLTPDNGRLSKSSRAFPVMSPTVGS